MTSNGYKWVTRIGAVATLFYFGYFIGMLHVRWDELVGLKLNELGDLLAGVVGPIALIWVVLGYFQQGHELREATIQNAELTKVGEGQLREAQTAQKLVRERHLASFEPVFHFQIQTYDRSFSSSIILNCKLINTGHAAAAINLLNDQPKIASALFQTKPGEFPECDILPNQSSTDVKIRVKTSDFGRPDPFDLRILYSNGLAEEKLVDFNFDISSDDKLKYPIITQKKSKWIIEDSI